LKKSIQVSDDENNKSQQKLENLIKTFEINQQKLVNSYFASTIKTLPLSRRNINTIE
jgi:hypothetical protein